MYVKKLLLVLSFLIVFAEAHSQPWAKPGARWHFSFMQLMAYGYIKMDYTGDTTVQGYECSILTKTMYAYVYPGYFDTLVIGKAYLYEYNSVVYYYLPQLNSFDTLYNFNALPGDKWKVHSDYSIQPDSGYVYVDSISVEVLNSDTLRCLFVSPVAGSCMGWYPGTKIFERMGTINDYMFPQYVDCIADANEGGPLRCYSDSAFPLVTFDYQHACDYITFVPHVQQQDISPNVLFNALSGRVEVFCPQCNNSPLIQIFNLQGNILFQTQLHDSPTYVTFNIAAFPAGLYIVSIIDENGFSYKRKIVLTF